MFGVNLSGAEFGSGVGTYGWTYIYPSASTIQYYADQGIDSIRLPFKWERIQSEPFGELNQAEVARIKTFLDNAQAAGMKVVLDVHNFGSYNGNSLGTEKLPTTALGDLWAKIAAEFKDHPAVEGYGLMNEPVGLPTKETWPTAAQEAIDAIREVDSDTAIYVMGYGYGAAQNWLKDNDGLKNLVDSGNNLVFEAHQYFDRYTSGWYAGTYDSEGAYADVGVDRLQPFIKWLEDNNLKGYIGEYSVPDNDPRWLTVMDNFLAELAEHNIPSAYYGAGPWWGNYPMSLEPDGGIEAVQLTLLKQHIALYNNSLAEQEEETEQSPVAEEPVIIAIPENMMMGTLRAETLEGLQGHINIIRGEAGNDKISGQEMNDEIYGGAGNDLLYGNDGDDALYGENDNDRLYGGAGIDLLDGGAGNDYLYGGQDSDTLSGGLGNDVLYGDEGADTLDGGSGNDILYGGDDADSLSGGDGVDKLYGEAGNDTIDGGTGNDYLYGGDGEDILTGGAGNDYLYGQNGNDYLEGNDGNDVLDGGDGDDFLAGGIGNDTLRGGYGTDRLEGGIGDDRLYGGAGNDYLLGADGRDLLYGDADDDQLDGGAGNDVLYGGTGNDVLLGGDDIDKLYGEDGDDALDGGNGNDYLYGGNGNDIVLGGDGNDYLYGQNGDDQMDGAAGNDSLDGGYGDDTIYGGTGLDTIRGNYGNDTIYGGDDNDRLYGGDGDDIIYGDDGNDYM
ncbi:MAG: hypothetical protein DI551_10335, partial [Micavibrio aeruginosavorus]